MAQSRATTVEQYLAEQSPEARAALERVRAVILDNLQPGFTESMSFGMIGYGVPLERYPHTYNGQPLAYAALAAQKNYNALYLMSAYQDATELRAAFDAAGLRLDMGKSCVRFKRPEDLPLDAIGRIIARHGVAEWIATVEAARAPAKTKARPRRG